MILIISGKQGSGKTTLQKSVAKVWESRQWHRSHMVNFADAIYKMHDFCLGYLRDHGIARDIAKDGALLQLLGTEWGRRTIDEDIWVNMVKAKIERLKEQSSKIGFKPLFIIGDCRFKNELDAFPEAVKVRLECPREVRKERCSQWRENENHQSETALDHLGPIEWTGMFSTNEFDVETCTRIVMTYLARPPKITIERRCSLSGGCVNKGGCHSHGSCLYDE